MEEVRAIIEERRVSSRSDFISDLVNARDQGDKLSDSALPKRCSRTRMSRSSLNAAARSTSIIVRNPSLPNELNRHNQEK
jgi:hypothetical protein